MTVPPIPDDSVDWINTIAVRGSYPPPSWSLVLRRTQVLLGLDVMVRVDCFRVGRHSGTTRGGISGVRGSVRGRLSRLARLGGKNAFASDR